MHVCVSVCGTKEPLIPLRTVCPGLARNIQQILSVVPFGWGAVVVWVGHIHVVVIVHVQTLHRVLGSALQPANVQVNVTGMNVVLQGLRVACCSCCHTNLPC